MSYISIDTFKSVWTDDKGQPKKNKLGEFQGLAELRVRVDEGDKKSTFSLNQWRQIVAARGNKFIINETFTPEKSKSFPSGKEVPGRSAILQSNGIGDDLVVEKGGEPRQVYNLQTGLADAFALVCTNTEIAQRSAGK